MKKGLIISFVFVILSLLTSVYVCAKSYTSKPNETTIEKKYNEIKNDNFSIKMPKELEGTYETDIEKDEITVFHKDSKVAGFGGLVFSLKIYASPVEYANAPGVSKIGELIDKKGNIFDMTLITPTDVQYDYTKEFPKSFEKLAALPDTIEITGINGKIYFKDKGMKGEKLYKEVLKKHVKAIKTNMSFGDLERNEMSNMYYVLAQSNPNVMDKIGYTYFDINGDGIEELLIGEIAQGEEKGTIYDIYTMVNRQPKHVISGEQRNKYFVCDASFLCNVYSAGINDNGLKIYILMANSTELYHQVSFKMNSSNVKPWYISYDSKGLKWENVDEETYNTRIQIFENTYKRFDFIPFSSIK